MDVYDPNGSDFQRERRAELLRETENHRHARLLRMVRREKSTRHPGRARRPGYRIRKAPRISGEAT
ncbi:MAG: hypothetical protein M3N18_00850 [Actinomycetota bacterium]|nr:hypothetical protein [Actinomycetota bacterium]